MFFFVVGEHRYVDEEPESASHGREQLVTDVVEVAATVLDDGLFVGPKHQGPTASDVCHDRFIECRPTDRRAGLRDRR